MESSDKTWSTGEGNGKTLQYSCLENTMNSMKRQKYRTLKDDLPRSVGVQYATGDQWRTNSRKTKKMEPRKNNTHLRMSLVKEVKSDAVRAILHRKLECSVHESRQIGSGQTRDVKSEHRHFRNQ